MSPILIFTLSLIVFAVVGLLYTRRKKDPFSHQNATGRTRPSKGPGQRSAPVTDESVVIEEITEPFDKYTTWRHMVD